MAKFMKLIIPIIFLTLLVPAVLASLVVEKEPIAKTIIKEFNSPAVFNITIENEGPTQNFIFDTLLDIVIQPSNSFVISSGETKSILLKAFFSDNLKRKYSGGFDFAYFIKGSSGEIFEDSLNIKIVSLEDAISVDVPEAVGMKDENVIITIQNQESVILDMNVKVESDLFDGSETISLEPHESKEVIIKIDPQKIWKEAGDYDVVVTLSSENYDMVVNDIINLKEFKDVSVEENNLNLLFYKKKTVTTTLTGNVVQTVSTELEQTPFEKAFTSFNTEPNSVKEQDDGLVYTWEKELGVGESFIVTSTTNFLLPLFILIFIAGGSAVYVSKSQQKIIIKKKVVKARTSTDEFVLKVITTIKNKGENATNVRLIDKLPVLTNIHERFGVVKPDQIEKDRLIYNIGDLNKGDKRLFSYIVHSDVKVLGRRLIPRATAYYNVSGKDKSSESNEVFLLS